MIDKNIEIKGKTFFITGATGLIGGNLVSYLKKEGANVLGLSRQPLDGFIIGTVENLPNVEEPIDYIIHTASPTASSFFVEHPVETIETAVLGTRNVLELAKRKAVKGFVFLSSMEVYGFPQKGHKVKEEEVAGFDTTAIRNCYPISKQLCENLCCAYANEYNVPAKIVRLTQTFGPGMRYNDTRIFAEFVRCAIEKNDIILRTKGETERAYLYIDDAVEAILTVLFNGKVGEAYNAANPETYCSIAEMAKTVADEYGINVVYEQDDITKYGYANTLFMNLSIKKIIGLGWEPKVSIKKMFKNTINDIVGN